jgi:hypothetical protein
MKYTILTLAVVLLGCGGSIDTEHHNPFHQAIGRTMVDRPTTTSPTDPFAPILKKN